jgi:hypothetical protein
MEDQIVMGPSGIMEQIITILGAEEVGSSLTPRPRRRQCYINHDLEAAHLRLQHDYFDGDCVYTLSSFRRRYDMRTLFLSIINKLSETSLYFTERHDATGRIGLTLLQKYTTALRQLAYDMVTNTIDEYMKLGKKLTLECLKYYCASIIECYGAELLCHSTVTDTQCLLGKIEER